MKKLIYTLILRLSVVTGFVLYSCQIKNESTTTAIPKPLPAADVKAAMKQWEATPEGMKFKQWKASPAGKKVFASEAKISTSIRNYTDMKAVITALALPPGSRLGFGVMARINGDDYILSFGLDPDDNLQQLHSLKVDDTIILRSHSVSHAPKYPYPILSADYVERDRTLIYKRSPRKGGC